MVVSDAGAIGDGWGITARLHGSGDSRFLWITNPTREPKTVEAALSESTGAVAGIAPRWRGEDAELVGDRLISVTADGRNAAVIQLT